MRTLRIRLLLAVAAFIPLAAFAQESGSETVYRAQLIDLHSKAIGIFERIEKSVPKGMARIQTNEEIFALVKLVHRLDEEAAATNLEVMRRRESRSKVLLLVGQASMAIDSMLNAISNYIDTDDRAFLGFARDSNAQVWTIRRVM